MNQIHSLIVLLRDRENTIVLWYDDVMSAMKARDRLATPTPDCCPFVETTDDYGRHLSVACDQVGGLLVTDLTREMEGNGQIALMQARAQAKAQSNANADPALRFHATPRPPGIIG